MTERAKIMLPGYGAEPSRAAWTLEGSAAVGYRLYDEEGEERAHFTAGHLDDATLLAVAYKQGYKYGYYAGREVGKHEVRAVICDALGVLPGARG
jgi:hypothetical protein